MPRMCGSLQTPLLLSCEVEECRPASAQPLMSLRHNPGYHSRCSWGDGWRWARMRAAVKRSHSERSAASEGTANGLPRHAREVPP